MPWPINKQKELYQLCDCYTDIFSKYVTDIGKTALFQGMFKPKTDINPSRPKILHITTFTPCLVKTKACKIRNGRHKITLHLKFYMSCYSSCKNERPIHSQDVIENGSQF